MKEPAPNTQPNAWVKTALSWSIAVGLGVTDGVFHWRCGIDEVRRRKRGLDCKEVGTFLDWAPGLTEGICRCLVSIALAGLAWEVAVSVGHGKLASYTQRAFIGIRGSGVYVASALAGFTLVLGLWDIFGEIIADGGGLPKWGQIYLHVFEVMCQTAVFACLAGICFDLVCSGSCLNAMMFVKNLVHCTDNVEDHAHWGTSTGTCHGRERYEATNVDPEVGVSGQRADMRRVVLLWMAFLITFFCVIFDAATGHQHGWIAMPLDVFGVICISGIAFAIVRGAADIGFSVLSALTQSHLAALIPSFQHSRKP